MQNYSAFCQVVFELHLKNYCHWSLYQKRAPVAGNFPFAAKDILQKKKNKN